MYERGGHWPVPRQRAKKHTGKRVKVHVIVNLHNYY